MQEKPEFWIIAGVNGSGKTTVAQEKIKRIAGQITHINPDAFVKDIQSANPSFNLDTANLAALKKARNLLIGKLEKVESVAIETTLSSLAYEKYISLARAKGFKVNMLYIGLEKVEQCINRVAERVKAGGHDVPIERIYDRWPRSHDNLVKLMSKLDDVFVYSNDLIDRQVLVAIKQKNRLHLVNPKLLPEVTKRLEPLIQQQNVKDLSAQDKRSEHRTIKEKSPEPKKQR